MLITRVELENIKNYDAVAYNFEPGITAISGPNGSGKTTIIESIAYALFDYLPYKKEDFLKRGATKGTVRVTFTSEVDGREYTVYRDTANGYFIYDPITQGRLVEQKSQVIHWIRDHLGIDARTDLRTLFTSTIGVPQGTFTLEFADQPAKRKIGFDRVLRVEDYQKASEALRPLIKLLDGKESDLENDIARLTLEVSPFDEMISEKKQLENLLSSLKHDQEVAEKDLNSVRAEIDRLNEVQSQIETLKGETQNLRNQLEGLDKVRNNLVEGVRISETASALVQGATAGFEEFNNAVSELSRMEPLLTRRDDLRRQLSIDEKEAVKLEVLITSQREKRTQIESYKKEVDDLSAAIKSQDEVERRLRDIDNRLAEISIIDKKIESEEAALRMLRVEFKNLTMKIEEGELQKEEADKLPILEKQKKVVEETSKKAQVTYEKLLFNNTQVKVSKENLEKIRGEISTLENEVLAGQEDEKFARLLPALETDEKNINEEITIIKTTVQREEKIISEISDGLCPLLSQKCLNMKEGERLDAFFTLQISSEKKRLRLLEQQLDNVTRRMTEAKNALRRSSRLDVQRVHLERCRQNYSIEQNNLNNLLKESDRLPSVETEVATLSGELETLGKELVNAREAYLKFQGVGMLKEQLGRISEEGVQKKAYLKQIRETLSQKENWELEKGEVECMLHSLNDPRGRTKHLQIEINKEAEVLATLTALQEREVRIQEVIKKLSEELQVFNNLDENIAKVRDQRARNAKDYQLFIENQPIAALLDSRREELNKVETELNRNREELEQRMRILDDYLNTYDESKHLSLKGALDGLIRKIATVSAERGVTIKRLEELASQIKKLSEVKKRIEELIEEQKQNERLLSISEFIREVLKNSGPHITEAHLKSISIEANQLYRDITGNPMTSLKWDSGYEIILEEEGFERPFVSLSGGEQMSAALSVRLALLKELSDIRLAFFDEPTTNMDEERRRNLAEQIGRIKDLTQLFVISHDDTFEGFTDQLIDLRN